MNHINAMRLALENIIEASEYLMPDGHKFQGKAITALTAALAESSEPVAFICCGEVYLWPSTDPHCAHVDMHIPLYMRKA
jgi:hypothetical protein